jgi:hypothetical protein
MPFGLPSNTLYGSRSFIKRAASSKPNQWALKNLKRGFGELKNAFTGNDGGQVAGVSTQGYDPSYQGSLDASFGMQDPGAVQDPAYTGAYQTANTAKVLSNMFGAADAGTATGTTGGTGDAQQVSFNGVVYNTGDPAQLDAYFQARLSYLTQVRDQYLQEANSAASSSLTDAAKTYAEQAAQIDQDIADTQVKASDLRNAFQQNIKGLDQSRSQGLGDITSRYASYSPNAFQSSQGTLEDYTNQNYFGELANQLGQADEKIGANYLSSGNMADIGENSLVGQQLSRYNQDRSGIDPALQTYRDQTQQGLNQNVQGINDWVTQQKDAISSDIGQFNPTYAFNAFGYGRNGAGSAIGGVTGADLGKLNPFQGSASYAQGTTPGYTAPFKPTKNQNALDTYLNRYDQSTKSGVLNRFKVTA